MHCSWPRPARRFRWHSAAPQLRTGAEPDGKRTVPPEWAAYLHRHNALAAFAVKLVDAAECARTPWAVENPADCGDPRGRALWPQLATHAPIWVLPAVAGALARADAGRLTFAQCALGARAGKYTTVGYVSELEGAWGELEIVQCEHGREGHDAEVAHGRDTERWARAARVAAYPRLLNEVLGSARTAGRCGAEGGGGGRGGRSALGSRRGGRGMRRTGAQALFARGSDGACAHGRPRSRRSAIWLRRRKSYLRASRC
eukprot:61268-Pleurochrysis_carterae.AAC.1